VDKDQVMKLKHLSILAVTASMFLGASGASADTAFCYKNPGNNNGHRYVVNYWNDYHDVIVTKRTKQNWNGRTYVNAGTNGRRTRLTWTNHPKDICNRLYNYRYYQMRSR
jgi:hypothetical protein